MSSPRGILPRSMFRVFVHLELADVLIFFSNYSTVSFRCDLSFDRVQLKSCSSNEDDPSCKAIAYGSIQSPHSSLFSLSVRVRS